MNQQTLQLQPRDDKILKAIFAHRFLLPNQVQALLGGSPVNLARRCRRLWRQGYLERPKAQRPTRALTEEIAYGLGKKGAQRLQDLNPDLEIGHLDWTETPKKRVGWPFMDHALGTSQIMSTLQVACRRRQLALYWSGHSKRRDYLLTLPGGRGSVLPDAYFIIKTPDRRNLHYFLEFDRGNVSLHRMRERYRIYFQWWKAGRHGQAFKGKEYRVLTITQDPDYMKSLRLVAEPIGRDNIHRQTWAGLLFSHLQAFNPSEPETIFNKIFFLADQEKPVSLL